MPSGFCGGVVFVVGCVLTGGFGGGFGVWAVCLLVIFCAVFVGFGVFPGYL